MMHARILIFRAIPVFTMVFGAIFLGSIDRSVADETVETRIPRVLIGDWFQTNHDCGSSQSSVSGMYIGPDGSFDLRNGSELCLIGDWRAENPIVFEHNELGVWYFSAQCTIHGFSETTGRAETSSQMTYGRISLRADEATDVEYLVIDRRDNRGSANFFAQEAPVNPRLTIVQRCPAPAPATHFGWAMPRQ